MAKWPRLLLATGNAGKIREFRALLSSLPYAMVSLADCRRPVAMPEETGTTYRENSRLKAQSVAQASSMITIADDSGLEVACLDGRPGLRSARYGPDDDTRISRLLRELAGRLPARAQFVCVASVATPDGRCRSFRGTCQGTIVDERRGRNGFGFDPVFKLAGDERRMAELTNEEKNLISHRARAFHLLARFLQSRRGRLWARVAG